ncbi:MAG TPA: hypothetical protein VHO25_15460, partial [Polyangiaceae bacterium]|nr:hypothetical protein [Polyangiaceae bacterium]
LGLVLSCMGAAACSASKDEPVTSTTNSMTPTGNTIPEDPSAPVVGNFAVTLVAATASRNGFTSVLGSVYDAPMPEQLAWEVAAAADDCELRVPSVPFCDPGCSSDSRCAPGDECIAYPTTQDVGTVRITGLGTDDFEMTATSGAYQPPPAISLPHPPTDEGAAIRLLTTGGAFEPFEIETTGIAPLALGGPERVPLDGSEPLALQWEPPEDEQAARIQIRLDISHHGGLKGEITCDVSDDGEHEVPAELIEQLIALGTAGFPSFTVTRIASGSVNIPPGRVQLKVLSSTERFFEIPGIVSCNEDDDCGTDGTCAPNRTCQ